MLKIACAVAWSVLACIAASSSGLAQTADGYPKKPIRIIVNVPAGGGVDTTARVLAEQLQRRWGQPVTIENRPGAGGNIGTGAVAAAEPDGYTLLATAPASLTVNNVLYKQLSYDPAKLIPVVVMAYSPNVFVVRHDLPIKSVAELIAQAKANPGKLSYASQGNGTTSHLTAELFQQRTGTRLVHVPFKGTAPALTDIAGGHVDVMSVDLGSVLSLHKVGQARIIAVASPQRIAALPETPTVAETLPGFRSLTWYALAAPPNTPPAIVARLNAALLEIMASPEVAAKYASLFINPGRGTPSEVAAFVAAESQQWGDVVRAANVRLD